MKPCFSKDKAKTLLIIVRVVAVVGAFCWLGHSACLVKTGWGVPLPQQFVRGNVKVPQAMAWTVWTVLAPLWFLLENSIFNYTGASKTEREQFKYSQDLAAKVWIAVAAVLLVLYFGKDIGGNEKAERQLWAGSDRTQWQSTPNYRRHHTHISTSLGNIPVQLVPRIERPTAARPT